jgi:hypothetical protein
MEIPDGFEEARGGGNVGLADVEEKHFLAELHGLLGIRDQSADG